MEKGNGDRVKSIFCDLILRSPFPGSEVFSEGKLFQEVGVPPALQSVYSCGALDVNQLLTQEV